MNVVVRVRISGLEGKDGRVGRSVELDDGLHRKRPVDEVRRLVVDIFHLDDDSLIVRICHNNRIDYTHTPTVSNNSDMEIMKMDNHNVKRYETTIGR